jgi:uncharacterized protein YuzB (UPF0349 family)
MKIQICRHFPKINTLRKKLSSAFPEDTIIIRKCISICKVCKTQPVAKIKGKKVKAKSISKLISKIEEKL